MVLLCKANSAYGAGLFLTTSGCIHFRADTEAGFVILTRFGPGKDDIVLWPYSDRIKVGIWWSLGPSLAATGACWVPAYFDFHHVEGASTWGTSSSVYSDIEGVTGVKN